MTQAYVTPWVFYAGDSATVSFPYPFRIGAAADLKVYDNGTLVSAYTVTGVGAANGGNVVFTTAPVDDHVLLILRRGTQAQLVDYIDNDPFGAQTHEGILDQIVRMIQDLDERFSRIPMLAQSSPSTARNLTFPAPDASKVIGWTASTPPTLTNHSLTSYTFGAGAPGWVSLGDFLTANDDLGTVDMSPRLQAACDAALDSGGLLTIPPARVGYRVDTPINLTNLDRKLTMVGCGQQAPTYGAALVAPVGGSLFLGNTGTGKAVFDCAGSSNLLFRGINITSLGMPTPSTVGFLFGTSTTAVAVEAPGGSNCSLENVAIQLQNADSSCPVYYAGGAGNSHFTNVWTLGVYGFYLTANNELALASNYVALGPIIGVASIQASACNLLGYGGGPVLVLETAHNQQWSQIYMATIFGGPSYIGQDYAMKVENCFDVEVKVAVDYFPTVMIMEGDCRYCRFYGSTFPNLTPLDVGVAIIAFFAGTVLRNCIFSIMPNIVGGPITNYHYTTNGITPSMVAFQSCWFAFDTQMSTFVCFLNATAAVPVPFFNVYFDGDGDTGTFETEINGVIADNAEKRTFINGIKFGTA